MKKSVNLLFCISLLFCACDDLNYAKAIKKDEERLFESHKKFFKSLAINGVISEKKYCEKCQLNKYQIIIELKEKKPEVIELGNLSYQPYYFFNNKNQLILSVTKNIYDSTKNGLFTEKKANSDSLICGAKQYNLLSGKKSQWLPN
jgi:hypothetical protein